MARIAMLAAMTALVATSLILAPRLTAARASAGYDWLQFDGDPQHSGNNTQETTLSASNVGTLTQLFQATLPAVADGSPVYLSGVSTPSGTRDLLFLTTKAGDLVALDAQTGQQVWIQHNPANGCLINNGSTACFTTASPAIDPGPGHPFVYSYGLDGKVHKYQVGDGAEITTGGWPETATIKDFDEKGSSALSTAILTDGASYLYVTNAGYPGDGGNYQGHVTAINLGTGAQNVFNSLCSSQAVHFGEPGQAGTSDCSQVRSGIWARVGVVFDSATNEIYLATGNGSYVPASGDWADSVFTLNPDGTGSNGGPLDSYTPSNFATLQAGDLDLGSTAPAILPAPAASSVQNLGLQGGKDAKLRLLNLQNLSGQGGPGHTGGEVATTNVPQGNEVLTQPAVWVDGSGTTWAFVSNDSGISGLQLTVTNGTPGLTTIWQGSVGGTSPIVANGVLYYATLNNTIRALDPATGKSLWQGAIGGIHWESPIVANGVLYVPDENANLTAFALPFTESPTPSVTASPSATLTLSPTPTTAGSPSPTTTATPTMTGGSTATPTPTPRPSRVAPAAYLPLVPDTGAGG